MVSCLSCGHENNGGSWCQACGAALPSGAADDDSALSLMLGLVCEKCDSYNDPGSTACFVCSTPFGGAASAPSASAPSAPAPTAPAPAPAAAPATQPSAPAWMMAPEGQPLATANAMPAVDLAVLSQSGAGLAAPSESDRRAVETTLEHGLSQQCPSCQAPFSASDRFCPQCGARLDGAAPADAAPVPPSAPGNAPARTQMMAKAPAPAGIAPPQGATLMMPSLGDLGGGAPSATMFFGAATVERFARLILVKGHTQLGSQWRLQAGQTVIGRSQGVVLFPDDAYLSPTHCRLEFRGEDLFLVTEPTPNGVFVKITGQVPLRPGDELVVGTQRMRLLSSDDRAQVLPPEDGDTRLLGSLIRRDEPIILERLGAPEGMNEVFVRPQRLLSIGRAQCDLTFPDDPYLSTRHVQLVRGPQGVVLEDLQSRNGTYVRVHGERKLAHGDAIMLGEQVLRVELAMGR